VQRVDVAEFEGHWRASVWVALNNGRIWEQHEGHAGPLTRLAPEERWRALRKTADAVAAAIPKTLLKPAL
jgi:hypothetical protein